MKCCIRIVSIFLFVLYFYGTSSAQIDTESKTQRFAFQVKQIDEFFERFNGESSTLLSRYITEHYPDRKTDRNSLLSTLFNQSNSDWDKKEVQNFINDITCEPYPVKLSYYDADWYAKLECEVRYKGELHPVSLTLQVETSDDLASEWVLRGVKADFLKLPVETHPSSNLNPVSHGTDFMNLPQLFRDKRYVRGYIHRDFEEDMLTLFTRELALGNLQLENIHHIDYHFLQIHDWTFVISKVKNDTFNSGWLINSLKRMSAKEKEFYRKKVLSMD